MTQDAIGRLRAACERAEDEYPKLAAPDGTVAVQFTDLRTLLTALDGDEVRNMIALVIDKNYHTAISKALSTADEIIGAITGKV